MIKAAIATMLLAQAQSLPAPVQQRCGTREQLAQAITVALPLLVRGMIDACTPVLPQEAFLRREGRNYVARLQDIPLSEGQAGLRAIRESSTINGRLPETEEEAVEPLDTMLDRLVPSMTTASCGDLNAIFEALAPLPPQAVARAIVGVLATLPEGRRPNLCPA